MRCLFFEGKIMGVNALLVYVAVTLVVTVAAVMGGELLNMSVIAFEVIYPLITAIAVGEWGKTRADESFDCIAAQSTSLFKWVVARTGTAFLTGSAFAFIGMVMVFLIRKETSIGEMALLYCAPAFFLSSLCALCGICLRTEHTSTLISGIFWLISLLSHALLSIPVVHYVYLFIRYAGDANGVWLANKLVLMLIGIGLWVGVYVVCKNRYFRHA